MKTVIFTSGQKMTDRGCEPGISGLEGKSEQESLNGENGETEAGKPIILGQTLKEETYAAIHDGGAVSDQSAEQSVAGESAGNSGKTAGLRVSRQPSVRPPHWPMYLRLWVLLWQEYLT